MLLNVITDLAADTGLTPISQKRSILLRLANKAAKEMYNQLECNKIYKEVTLAVPRDKVVSLPSFIGELRGTRMHTNELPFDIHSIGQPRYASNTLQYRYKNWRDLAEAPTHTLPSLIGPLTITTQSVEDTPITILINGQTDKAQEVEEQVVMDGVSKTTNNLFGPQIFTIACMTLDRNYDITISDANGNELAILYSSDLKTRYKIVDVSPVFWSIDTAADESLIDVLYKVQKKSFSRDSDSFYAGDDFDEAWYNMAMFMHLKPLQNRLQDALAHKAVAEGILQSAKESGEEGIMKKMQWGRNPRYSLFRKLRYWPGAITNVDRNS